MAAFLLFEVNFSSCKSDLIMFADSQCRLRIPDSYPVLPPDNFGWFRLKLYWCWLNIKINIVAKYDYIATKKKKKKKKQKKKKKKQGKLWSVNKNSNEQKSLSIVILIHWSFTEQQVNPLFHGWNKSNFTLYFIKIMKPNNLNMQGY